ncbi:MAG: Mur ligase domain-containing protein [Actinobacteria bacterium]|nr:Mur ligase domain-containing protein [Actinomycetota bacterium]
MAADVAQAISGQLVGANAHLDGVSFDSRTIKPGQLFVPIIDQRDGHDFIADALSRGAGAYITSRAPQAQSWCRCIPNFACATRPNRDLCARHRKKFVEVG